MSFLSLFTTPAPGKTASGSSAVADAVRQGASQSGASFDYLLKTAKRESSLDPNAKASTSSATGLFQFIEQTWLSVMKTAGAKHGLQRYADAITSSASGRLSVADPGARAEILGLRKDPQISAAMAGELTRRNGAALADALGRAPTDGELYLAHVMGAGGASALLSRAEQSPDASAARYFPDEAAANRSIFYAAGGRARTLAEVRERLTAGFATQSPPVAVAAAETSATPAATGAWLAAFPQAPTQGDGTRPLDVLFQTAGARGAVSSTVASLWSPREQLDSYFALRDSNGAAPGKPLDLLALMRPIST